jgi:hypothetical protein
MSFLSELFRPPPRTTKRIKTLKERWRVVPSSREKEGFDPLWFNPEDNNYTTTIGGFKARDFDHYTILDIEIKIEV